MKEVIAMREVALYFDAVFDALCRFVGPTGHAKVGRRGLYVKQEEHATWMCLGPAQDADDAQEAIDQYVLDNREA